MRFNEIQSRNQLADFLGLQRKTLSYVLFKAGVDSFYTSFDIPKKDGTARHINAPNGILKIAQRTLANKLYEFLDEIRENEHINACISHAFEKNKSIITNAKIHKNKRFVFCVDLSNFFDSFHFGRVMGFFSSNRYFNLPKEVAITIAQLTCYKGHLPQGAPTSPIITNLICQTLDIHVLKIAKKYKLDYTRYADDLTFSTNRKDFIDFKDRFYHELIEEITRSGFSINEKKTRLMYHDSRQTVTGLVVNEKINIPRNFYKETRAMLHSLYTTGKFTINGKEGSLNQLEGRLSFIYQVQKYNNQHDNGGKKHNCNNLSGKEKDYRNFLFYKYFVANEKPILITEGKTDILYIKAALKNLCDNYPRLIAKIGDNKFNYHISFYPRTSTLLNTFFGTSSTGADTMKKIYNLLNIRNKSNLNQYFYKLGTIFTSSPVIMLFDNESNSDRPLKNMINHCSLNDTDKEKLKTENYITLDNTNPSILMAVPLPKDKSECELEDLFTEETLNIELNGKKFSRQAEDTSTSFGKSKFSEYIISHYKDIDFSGFIPLLNIIDKVS